jgi:hypothetical protein
VSESGESVNDGTTAMFLVPEENSIEQYRWETLLSSLNKVDGTRS